MNIICYLSNGYPSLDASFKLAKEYADAGCNMIEIDFPARDPYLESEYLANRMGKSLEACDDYEKYMDSMVRVKKELPDMKLLVLAYESTVLEIGVVKFIEFCKENEFSDVILVGLKNDAVKNQMIEAGIKVSCYVQYQMLEEEIEQAKASNGFVYMQGKPAPGQVNPSYPDLKSCVKKLRDEGIERPIYCGVGIHEPDDVSMVKDAGGDAAFIGSTILKLQEDVPSMKDMICQFKAKC